jgi:hypothetical protein
MPAFSDTDKSRIRAHLGYPDVDTGASGFGGVVRANTVQNELEFAMDHVTANCVTRVQGFLTSLDGIETQMVEANERLQASKADVVVLNPDEHKELLRQYKYWQSRVCNVMAVKVNPYAESSGLGINVRLARRR